MKKCNSAETVISLKDVKDGDIVLYELKEEPSFVKPIKDNLETNFYVLIDKLICFAEGSHITHAAMVYDSDKVVEATIPAVRIGSHIANDDYRLHIRRVRNGIDGSVVLKYLPQTIPEIEADGESYAMMMAVVAGVSCLVKAKVRENENLGALATIIRYVLYKVASYLDNKKLPYSNGDDNWFCSQLVYYTYTTAAAKIPEPAFDIALPDTSTPIADTLIHKLVSRTNARFLGDESVLLKKPAAEDEVYALAENFFNPDKSGEKKNAVCGEKAGSLSAEDASFFLTFINKLCNNKFDFSDIEKELIKFQSAFVMPSDLRNCLDEGYLVSDEE